eukprot:gnl/TRDRNA2_/TRDRNA2_138234_c0_seq4.p1 gnl/TRDRNA2_/TRDRNA2_138234_c0~~gnl/TRDRNA2_/TRDRNA2_138234_c0_seq4.p1  ORF type:complete len:243 (+),score=64.08 gnl/TRDRNA2_/TRDRNA2_138234_c0_seq4:24-731(+)
MSGTPTWPTVDSPISPSTCPSEMPAPRHAVVEELAALRSAVAVQTAEAAEMHRLREELTSTKQALNERNLRINMLEEEARKSKVQLSAVRASAENQAKRLMAEVEVMAAEVQRLHKDMADKSTLWARERAKLAGEACMSDTTSTIASKVSSTASSCTAADDRVIALEKERQCSRKASDAARSEASDSTGLFMELQNELAQDTEAPSIDAMTVETQLGDSSDDTEETDSHDELHDD